MAGLLLGSTATLSAPRQTPPQTPLRVEMRVVSSSPANGASATSADGSFTVDSRRGATATDGAVTLSTRKPPQDDNAELLLQNGGSASLHIVRSVALPTGEWYFGAAAGGAAGRTASGAAGGATSAGFGQTRQWLDTRRGFQVHATWPGGDKPVALDIAAQTSERAAVQTQLLVPLAVWTPFARLADTVLQVRVSLP
jgi:hypothetical protein